jgi:hypothetical protein
MLETPQLCTLLREPSSPRTTTGGSLLLHFGVEGSLSTSTSLYFKLLLFCFSFLLSALLGEEWYYFTVIIIRIA